MACGCNNPTASPRVARPRREPNVRVVDHTGRLPGMVDCRHWSPGIPKAGRCALGLFGGRPSVGTCGACTVRERIRPTPEQRVKSAFLFVRGRVRRSRAWAKSPGDVAKWLIGRAFPGADHGALCEQRRVNMNRLGWRGCWRERSRLIVHFHRQARRAGDPVGLRPPARVLLYTLRAMFPILGW